MESAVHVDSQPRPQSLGNPCGVPTAPTAWMKKISDELIEQIKRGDAPWQKPWKPGERCTPENFSTGKSYTGGNSLYLMSRGIRQGFGDNRWGTYK